MRSSPSSVRRTAEGGKRKGSRVARLAGSLVPRCELNGMARNHSLGFEREGRMSAINRDSLELRRIVFHALREAKCYNWDMVQQDNGTAGVEDLMEEIYEKAIRFTA